MTDISTALQDPLEEVAPPRRQHGAAAWAVWMARRLGLAALTLWLVSVLTFLATAALGDPIRAILGRDYNSNPGRVQSSRSCSAPTSRWCRATSTGWAACSRATWVCPWPTHTGRPADLRQRDQLRGAGAALGGA